MSDLGPHLLAVIIAKLEEKGHHDRVVRRLQSRFEVQTADRLQVKFRLRGASGLERSVELPKFYLRRTSVEAAGAITENHYTLYVSGHDNVQSQRSRRRRPW